MPELPEVEITKRKLAPLVGKRIAGFWIDWPRTLKSSYSPAKLSQDIKGRRIMRLRRIGKAVFFDLYGLRILAFHQRMSGSLQIKSKSKIQNAKVESGKKYVHVKVFFIDGTELWFEDPRKFGVVWYGAKEDVEKDKYIASLGPDALGLDFKTFVSRLTKHKGMIKPLLLRQDAFSGIGNIVADETLWIAKIHPKRLISNLSMREIKNLFLALKKILDRAIKAKGTTLRNWQHPDGEVGGFQNYMKVYGRKGEKCPRCRNKIIRIVIGSRGTWLCLRCQRL